MATSRGATFIEEILVPPRYQKLTGGSVLNLNSQPTITTAIISSPPFLPMAAFSVRRRLAANNFNLATKKGK